MPRTETTIVTDETGVEVERSERQQYTLAELKEANEAGFDRAIEKLAEWEMQYDWWDTLLDSETDHIEETYGITYVPKNVTFDLYRREFAFGRTQDVDARVLLKKAGIDLRTKEARQIIDHGLVLGVSYWHGERGWIGFADYEGMPDYISDEVCDAIRDVLRDAQNEMLRALDEESEYLTGEEHLMETAEINEVRFYEDGRVA